MFCTVTVVLSSFYIPIGTAKIFPIQHAMNVIISVLFGPLSACLVAFVTSTIRILLGTGSLLAYPGSLFGAFFADFLFKKLKNLSFALLGECIGTGFIGTLLISYLEQRLEEN